MARPPARFALLVLVALAACNNKPTPERIDSWPSTVDGVAKLNKAFRSPDLETALRARAAAHLVALGETPSVIRDLEARPEPALVDPLISFLASDATVASELQVPTPSQVAAKDALFDLRKLANRQQRNAIDAILSQWLTGYYDGRASLGRHTGEAIIIAAGTESAAGLIAALLKIIEQPQETSESFSPVSDDLLRGLALAGPLGVGAMLDVVERKVGANHPDITLQTRAIAAVSYAFEPGRQNRRVLVPVLRRLQTLAGDIRQPPAVSNLAFDLLALVGKPICLEPLTILAQHGEEIRVLVALRKGLECAGADAIIPLAEALRPDRDVDFETLESFFWDEVGKLGPSAAPPARTLLSSRNWLARLTGVKVLQRVGDYSDVARLRSLESDNAPLRGKPGKDTKRAAMTVGGEARQAADHLEKKQ